ncbi:HNH endonuclease [Alteromonas sp. ASW11-19]|uniref:HNH endonuclease n=1 Tax=Alteromonas salexigens TaxID=2982530 RepID=A0ABT2VLV6_9ALTE|nr:HNH endonuclease [Alteromonas salexigens]MCU7554300.1 HNH endonuclease [Alteromonas salexigens]
MLVLRLNKAGMPQEWIHPEHAARLYCQEKVLFELGSDAFTLHGGWNRDGVQSTLRLASIIACTGKVTDVNGKIALTNRFLFRRDNYLCLYCGHPFPPSQLTRDHILPRSRGGKDSWTNVATACSRCNHAKGAQTPEEAHMPLLAVPFRPNLYERFYLMNRRILADQMSFLESHFTQRRDWHVL